MAASVAARRDRVNVSTQLACSLYAPSRSTMRVQQTTDSFALCVEGGGSEDLEARKLYQVLPAREAAREGYIRIVDESGEDYIYPSDLFVPVRLPAAVVRRLRRPAHDVGRRSAADSTSAIAATWADEGFHRRFSQLTRT